MEEIKHQLLYPSATGEVEIRTIDRNGRVLFCFPDVVKVLSKDNRHFSNLNGKRESFQGLLSKSAKVLKDKDRILMPLEDNNEFGSKYDYFITEAGLYRIVTVDESEAALKFQDWVYEDVLPSIRKYGKYPAPKEGVSAMGTMVSLLQQNVNLLAQEIEKRELLEQKVYSIDERVSAIESESENSNLLTIQSVLQKIDQLDLGIENIWAWCEKIRLQSGADYQKCNSGDRLNTRYPMFVIDQAINELKNTQQFNC